jgi:hypothetical protein
MEGLRCLVPGLIGLMEGLIGVMECLIGVMEGLIGFTCVCVLRAAEAVVATQHVSQ